MTYTIAIPLAITAACFVHFHHRTRSGSSWVTRAIHGLMNLGLAFTMNVGTWVVWWLIMRGLA